MFTKYASEVVPGDIIDVPGERNYGETWTLFVESIEIIGDIPCYYFYGKNEDNEDSSVFAYSTSVVALVD